MKPTITYEDFEKLDIRVGRVIEASIPDWSNKLIELKVDFGQEIGEKTILSGIKKWYSPEDLQGKNFPFIINLAERKMGPGVSQGMMIMADDEEKPVVFSLPDDVAPGVMVR